MPSKASKEKRKATRAMENAQQKDGAKSAQHSTEPNSTTITAVDGKQATTEDPQMQNTTRNGDGKQSEWRQSSELQQTTHLLSRTGKLATKLLQLVATEQRQLQRVMSKSIRGSKVIDTFGTQYSVITKGLFEMQLKRACEKAYLEAFNQMGIVLGEAHVKVLYHIGYPIQ